MVMDVVGVVAVPIQQVEKLVEWHKDIFNWGLQHPAGTRIECATHFGVTEGWIGVIKNSDIYIEFAARQRRLHDANVSKTVIERVEDVAEVALDVLHERLQNERDKIGLGIVNDTAAMALRALGFGAKGNGREGTQVNISLGVVDPKLLERAREKMRVVNAHETPGFAGADTPPKTIDESGNEETPDQPPKSLPTPA